MRYLAKTQSLAHASICTKGPLLMERQLTVQMGAMGARIHRDSLMDALLSARSGGLFAPIDRQGIRQMVFAAGSLTRTPELCVIAFKSVLSEVANEASIPLGRERSHLLERFVSVFIEEMYRTASPGAVEDGDCRGKTASAITPAGSRELPGAHP
jgi:hypothetical protein